MVGASATDGDAGGQRHSRRAYLQGAAATGLATGLAGCAFGRLGGGAGGSGTTVQFVADAQAKESAGDFNDALHEAGLSSDVTVEILAVDSDTASQQYTQWLSAGLEQPSLFRVDSGWTIPFIVRDQLVNLSEEIPEVTERVSEEFFDASVQTATGPDGGLYGVPLFTDFGLMLYRKDLVTEAGFDPSGWATSPPTWQRFSEVMAKTAEQSETDSGFTFAATVFEGLSCCTFNEFMTTRGGSYFGARENLIGNVGNRPVTVNTQPVIDALRMVRTFVYGDDDDHALEGIAGNISPRSALQWDWQTSLSDFTNGGSVAHRNWPYSVSSAGAEDAFGEGLGVMPIPVGVPPGEAQFSGMGGSKSALGGWHVALNPNAKEKEAALEVLRAISQDGFYLSMMDVFGYVPPKPGLLDTEEARNVDVMGRYVDTMRYAGEHAIPRPVSVVWPRESPRISQSVSAALTRDQTPEGAMADLEEILIQIEQSVKEASQ